MICMYNIQILKGRKIVIRGDPHPPSSRLYVEKPCKLLALQALCSDIVITSATIILIQVLMDIWTQILIVVELSVVSVLCVGVITMMVDLNRQLVHVSDQRSSYSLGVPAPGPMTAQLQQAQQSITVTQVSSPPVPEPISVPQTLNPLIYVIQEYLLMHDVILL